MRNNVSNMLLSIVDAPSRVWAWCIGGIAGVLTPTIPYGLICFFAVMLDVFSAYRLNRRVAKKHPGQVDGKFRSAYAKRIFDTMVIIYACVILAYCIDHIIYPFIDLYLANWIAGGFSFVQLMSVLENESSENDASWAKALQKILVNKVTRHLDIDADVLDTKQAKTTETTETTKKANGKNKKTD